MALEKGQEIYGMKISFVLKDADGVATYRVREGEGILKMLKHGVAKNELLYAPLSFLFADRGDDYVLYHHVNGETLEKRLRRLVRLETEEATLLTLDILRQLAVFHKEGLAYGNFSTDNVLIEVHGERPKAYLCGLGQLSPVTKRQDENTNSNERKGSNSDFDSDAFSNFEPDSEHDRNSNSNSYSVSNPTSTTTLTNSSHKFTDDEVINSEGFKKDLEGLARIIQLMLEGSNSKERVKVKAGGFHEESLLEKVMNQAFAHGYEYAQNMIDALEGKHFQPVKKVDKVTDKKQGKGFSVVAGMEELKEQLRSEVIDVLSDKEEAQKYGIDIPNGMLLYGPPGCGKTFIAARFAEETGYNYKYVKASDLASIYIHGSQEKIAQLFEEARQQAPTILCFDEFDALVPSRGDVNNTSLRSEVNEFLTQLDNCAKDDVFVIATTNRPDKIDSAILRTGRIDYKIYVPVPDVQARKEIFKMHISTRPHSEDLDYQALADLTDGYMASDIAAIVQQAARKAFKCRELITMELLKSVISQRQPSLSKETIAEYEKLKEQFENRTNTSSSRRPIGFY